MIRAIGPLALLLALGACTDASQPSPSTPLESGAGGGPATATLSTGAAGGSTTASASNAGGGGAGGEDDCPLGDGEPERVVQIAGGEVATLALTSRGRVACWGHNDYWGCSRSSLGLVVARPIFIEGLECITQVDHGLVGFAVDRAGALFGWGYEQEEELGDGSGHPEPAGTVVPIPVPRPVAQAAGGGLGGSARTAGGGAFVWGLLFPDPERDAPEEWPLPRGSSLVQSIRTVCELDAEGRARCRGSNAAGEVGTGTLEPVLELTAVDTEVRFRELHVEFQTSCGISLEGDVYCWGDNLYGVLGLGTKPLHADPLRFVLRPTQVVGLSNVVTLAVDPIGSCAVEADGDVFCWGDNTYDRFIPPKRPGPEGYHLEFPEKVVDMSPAKAAVVGFAYACFLRLDDTVWCRGAGLNRGIASGAAPEDGSATQVELELEDDE